MKTTGAGGAVDMSTDYDKRFSIQELQQMVSQSCRLAREQGIDAQGFICRSCPNPLGVGYTSATQ